MAVVQEQYINGVTIRIHDDSFQSIDNKAIQVILNRIAARALIDLSAGPNVRQNNQG